MHNKFAQIEFYFPQIAGVNNQADLAGRIVGEIVKNGSLSHCGYAGKSELQRSLQYSLGNGVFDYHPITLKGISSIKKAIELALLECHKVLPIPTKNYIFIYPFFPNKQQEVFQGSYGSTQSDCVFSLFIDLETYSKVGIVNSVVHEINHTIFCYYHHQKLTSGFNLLDSIVMEGLAENFRESVVGGKSMPWSIALNRKVALELLFSLSDETLYSYDEGLINEVNFGGKNYKVWSGYSMGYWLVKEFIKYEKQVNWLEIIKTKPEDILAKVDIKNIGH